MSAGCIGAEGAGAGGACPGTASAWMWRKRGREHGRSVSAAGGEARQGEEKVTRRRGREGEDVEATATAAVGQRARTWRRRRHDRRGRWTRRGGVGRGGSGQGDVNFPPKKKDGKQLTYVGCICAETAQGQAVRAWARQGQACGVSGVENGAVGRRCKSRRGCRYGNGKKERKKG